MVSSSLRRRVRLAAAAALVLTMSAACSTSGAAGDSSTVTVLAAASLTESFGVLEKEFERAHPGTSIEIGFGSSSALVVQLQNGASADVFASADNETMDKAGDVIKDRRTFASNALQIVVPAGNPRGIGSLNDLTKPGLIIAMAAPAVPAGRVARAVFDKAGLTAPPASQEPDVKSVLNRVVLGEADAGLVWATDVLAGKEKVQGIGIPRELGGTTKYPIASTSNGKNAAMGTKFIDFVSSDTGQRILREHGFGPA